MSIIKVNQTLKEEVFIRLIENNENVYDACSKAGISISLKMLSVIKNINK